MTRQSPEINASRKASLRTAALERRDGLDLDARLEWDQAICEQALALLDQILSSDPLRHSGSAPLRGLSGMTAQLEQTAKQQGDSGEKHHPPGVSAYWPMRSEADPRPVLEALHARGVSLCLPAIVSGAMIFRQWAPWQPIVPGGFGTLVPQPGQPEVAPGILLVPLAAFDRRGCRIGYGKGHYDRALAALGDVVTIGIAYGAQEIEAVPDEPHDRRLDWIVTETEAIRCG